MASAGSEAIAYERPDMGSTSNPAAERSSIRDPRVSTSSGVASKSTRMSSRCESTRPEAMRSRIRS